MTAQPGDRVVFRLRGRNVTGRMSYDRPSDPDHCIVDVDTTRAKGRTQVERHIVPRASVVRW